MVFILQVAQQGEDILTLRAHEVNVQEINTPWIFSLADAIHNA